MDRSEREARRDTFLCNAEDYSATRPGYPDALLQMATSLGALEAGSTVLEVGCGTGVVTSWLAAHGLNVRAIDRSREMVEIARQRLAEHTGVSVHHEDFEDGSASQRFDGLVFATSYHWLDPAERVWRCGQSLKPDGALILLWHVHPLPYTGFFARVEPIYKRFFPGRAAPASPGMSEERIQQVVLELEEAAEFGPVARRSHDWARTYDRRSYLRLLNTYSDHQRLAGAQREELYAELSTVIDSEYNGEVKRPYRTELVIARRAQGAR